MGRTLPSARPAQPPAARRGRLRPRWPWRGFLLKKKYMVHGIIRRSSSFNTGRIEDLYQDPHVDTRNLFLHYGDLTDSTNCYEIISKVQRRALQPWGAEPRQGLVRDVRVHRRCRWHRRYTMLNAIRSAGLTDKTRFYQASTSELFDLVQEVPQKETTPFYPRSPYAVAKQYAYWIVVNYREAYGMHASGAAVHEPPLGHPGPPRRARPRRPPPTRLGRAASPFRHPSPPPAHRRRPPILLRQRHPVQPRVARRRHLCDAQVTRAVAHFKGLQQTLFMGNIDAKRDWGHARDYVEMMWMMQQEVPDDYVVATGGANTARRHAHAPRRPPRPTPLALHAPVVSPPPRVARGRGALRQRLVRRPLAGLRRCACSSSTPSR